MATKLPIFLFDLETTGLGEGGERIVPVQIAAVVLDPDTFAVKGSFQTFVRVPEGAHIEVGAMEMHAKKGRTLEFFNEEGIEPQVAYERLGAFLKQYGDKLLPSGHNAAAYDVPIIKREALFYGVRLPLDHHVLDTAVLALAKLVYGTGELAKVGLKPLCDHLGVVLSEADAHDAINDVLATAQVLRKLMGKE